MLQGNILGASSSLLASHLILLVLRDDVHVEPFSLREISQDHAHGQYAAIPAPGAEVLAHHGPEAWLRKR